MRKESEFRPSWWIRNRHIQTLLSPLLPRVTMPNLHRERVELADGDFIDLEWTGSDAETGSDKTVELDRRPIVLMLHGLEGGIDSPYVQRMMRNAVDRGWRAVLMYFRGCSGELNRLPRTYHSGVSDDLELIVAHLAREHPSAPLLAVGYSLGGNVLLKWLGEQRDQARVSAACAISVPFDLALCAQAIDQGFSKLYKEYLLRAMRQRVLNKFSAARLDALFGLTPEQVANIKSFWEFDDLITAPLHGFKDVHDYYRRASCRGYIKDVQRPTLIIHAKDDPFMTPEVIPDEQELSPLVEVDLSEYGGHVGFISGQYPWRPDYYLESRVLAFFQTRLENQLAETAPSTTDAAPSDNVEK